MKASLLYALIATALAIVSGQHECMASPTPSPTPILPTVSIRDAAVTEKESYLSLNIPVSLSRSGNAVSVQWTTQDFTAVAGSDYEPMSGAIVFKPGQTKAQLRVIVRGDRIEERDEAFRIVLSAPKNARLAKSTGVVAIADNDYSGTVSVADVQGTEGNSGQRNFDFKVNLSSAPLHPLALRYATSDGTASSLNEYRPPRDYTAISGPLTIKPSQQSAFLKVGVAGDVYGEADENFSLKLSGEGIAFSKSVATGTILNDDSQLQPSTKGKIAYASMFYTTVSNIYIENADGSNVTRLTTGTTSDSLPHFSPDGSKIAFTASRDGNEEGYIMNADGTNQTRLTNNEAIDRILDFSPDGRSLLFLSTRDGNSEIYKMGLDGSNQMRLTNNDASDGGATFSPDGTKIMFASYRDGGFESHIYTMNADGSNPVRLTSAPGHQWSPRFSPDGKKIVYVASDPSLEPNSAEIYVMNSNGSSPRRLTTNDISDSSPCFSPDSTSIAFNVGFATNYVRIFVMSADGSNPKLLTSSGSFSPSWSAGYVPPPPPFKSPSAPNS